MSLGEDGNEGQLPGALPVYGYGGQVVYALKHTDKQTVEFNGTGPNLQSPIPYTITPIVAADLAADGGYFVSAVSGRVVGFGRDSLTGELSQPPPHKAGDLVVIWPGKPNVLTGVTQNGAAWSLGAFKYNIANPMTFSDPTYDLDGALPDAGSVSSENMAGYASGVDVLVQKMDNQRFRSRVTRVLETGGQLPKVYMDTIERSDLTTAQALAELNIVLTTSNSIGGMYAKDGSLESYGKYWWSDETAWAYGGSPLTVKEAQSLWSLTPDQDAPLLYEIVPDADLDEDLDDVSDPSPDVTSTPSWDDTSTGTPVEKVKAWYFRIADGFQFFRSWFFFIDGFNQ